MIRKVAVCPMLYSLKGFHCIAFLYMFTFTLCCACSLPAVIPSVNELIEELKSVVNDAETNILCLCLAMSFDDCNTIHEKRSNQPGVAWTLITDIATAWYEKSDEHGWNKVVSALKCMGKVTEAHNLAKRKESI